MSDVNALARLLVSSTPQTRLRRGSIVAVDGTAHTATVHLDGADIAGIPYYLDLAISVGDNVDVVFSGPSVRIFGVV